MEFPEISSELAEETGWHIIRGEAMLHKFMELIQPANSKHILKYQKFLNSKSL
jgi:hypothetical protein